MKILNRGIFLTITTAVCLVLAIGFCYNPMKIRFSVPREDDLLESYHLDSQTITHSIEIDDAGNLNLNGEDCYFEIIGIEHPGKNLVLNFGDMVETTGFSYVVTMDYGEGYQEAPDQAIYVNAAKFSNCVCINLPDAEYTALRIRPNASQQITSVELHEDEPTYIYKRSEDRTHQIGMGVALGLIGALFIAVLEWIFRFSEKTAAWLKENKWFLLQDIIALAASVLISLFFSHVVKKDSYSFVYNTVIITTLCSVFLLLRYCIKKEISVERTFFAITLLTGICMTLCCFPNVSWDAFIHYSETLQSTGLPRELKMTDADIYFRDGGYPNDSYLAAIEFFNKNGVVATGWLARKFRFFRLPGALGFTTAALFGVTTYTRYIAGRLGQLLCYALCGYFGIKRLKSGKMIFAVIYALPLNLFLATNYSYDYWVTGFIMLGFAYFVGMCQEKDEDVSMKDTIIMLAGFILGCMPKQIYAPIFLFPFLLSIKKTKNKKVRYYLLCVLAVVISVAMLYFASKYEFAKGGDARGGDVDPTAQLANVLANPIWFAGVLSRYLVIFNNPLPNVTFTYFGYTGCCKGTGLLTALIALVTLTDKNEWDKKAYNSLIRIYSVLFYVGCSAAIASALYLSFTPVGADTVLGAQPRYLIPLIYPLCSVVCGGGLYLKKYIPERIYNTVTMAIVFAISYYGVVTCMFPMTLLK